MKAVVLTAFSQPNVLTPAVMPPTFSFPTSVMRRADSHIVCRVLTENSPLILPLPLAACFMLVSCSAYSKFLYLQATILPKRRFIFIGLYGLISHEIELFITTAVRASVPAY